MPNDKPTQQYTNFDADTGAVKPVPLGSGVQVQATPNYALPHDATLPTPEDTYGRDSGMDLNAIMNKYVTVLGAHYNKADQDIADDFEYFNAVTGGTTFEEVRNRVHARGELAQQRVVNAETMVSPEDWVKYVYPVVDSLPYMKHVMEASAAGSATVGLGAAAVGSVAGPFTAGTAGGIGIVYGGPAAAFGYSAAQGTGRKYRELREAGVPDMRAKQLAANAGLFHGAIEAAQTVLLTKGFTTAFGAVLKTPYGKEMIKNAVVKFAANAGLEGLEEASDQIVSMWIDEIASGEFNIASLHASGEKWALKIAEAFLVGAAVGGTMRGIAGGLGHVTGKIVDKATLGKGTFEETGKANWADDMRTVLKAYKDVAKAEAEPELKPELATTLKQVLERGAKAEAKRLQGRVEDIQIGVTEGAVSKETTGLAAAVQELKDAKEALKESRKEKAAAAADMRAVPDGEDVPADVKAKYELSVEKEKVAKDDYDAAKLDVAKWELEEQLKNGNPSDEVRATINKEIDQLRAAHRNIKKRIAREAAEAKVEKIDNKISALVERRVELAKQHRSKVSGLKDELNDAGAGLSKAERKQRKRELDTEFAVADSKLKARIDNLRYKQSAINAYIDVIKSDLLSVKQIKRLRNTLESADVTELMQEAITAIRETGRDVAWAARADINKNRRILKNLIQFSGLSWDDQKTFMLQVDKVDTAADLRRIMEDRTITHTPGTKEYAKNGPTSTVKGFATRIAELLEQRNKERALAGLLSVVEKGRPAGSGSSKKSKFGFTTELQDIFDIAHKLLNPDRKKDANGKLESWASAHRRAVTDALTAYADELSNTEPGSSGTVDLDTELTAIVAELIGDVTTKSAEEIDALSKALTLSAKAGRVERIQEIMELRAKIAKAQKQIAAAIRPDMAEEEIEDWTRPHGELINPDRDAIGKRLKRSLKTLGKTTFSWEGKLDILLQKISPEARESIKEILNAGRVETKKASLERKYLEEMHDTISEVTGLTTQQVMKHAIQSTRKKISISYYQPDGTPTTTKMSVAHAQDLLAMLRDPDLHDGLTFGNGLTLKGVEYDGEVFDARNTTEGALERALADSAPGGLDLKVVEGFQKFYQKLHAEASEEYRAATGLKLEKLPGYSGPARRALTEFHGTNKEMLAELKQRFAGSTLRKGKPTYTKARTDSKLALHVDNIYTKASAYTQQLAHWRAWREPSNIMAGILGNYTVRTAIKLEYGDGFYAAINAHLHDMTVGTIERQTAWSKFQDYFLNRLGPLVLLGKPLQYPKQLTGFISAALEMNPAELIGGVVEFHTSIDNFRKMVNTEQFQNRYGNAYQTWLGTLYTKDPTITRDGAINEFLGAGLVGGDMHVSSAIAYAKYKAEIKKGATHERALEKAWDLVERTQSSSRKDQLNNLARDPAFTFMTIFRQQPTRAAEYRLTALRDMANGHVSVLHVLNTEIATRLAQAAFIAIDAAVLAALGTNEEEKEKAWRAVWREFIKGPLGPLGDLVGYLAMTPEALTTGVKDEGRLPQHPVLQSVQYIDRFNRNLLKAIEQGSFDTESVLILSILYAKGYYRFYGPRYPVEPVLKALKMYFGIENESISEKKTITW